MAVQRRGDVHASVVDSDVQPEVLHYDWPWEIIKGFGFASTGERVDTSFDLIYYRRHSCGHINHNSNKYVLSREIEPLTESELFLLGQIVESLYGKRELVQIKHDDPEEDDELEGPL